MMRLIFCTLFLFFIEKAVFAQDLHVYYNVFRDSVTYIQNGKPTNKPMLRKGRSLLLHVENYNNYLYDLSVEIENKEIPVASNNASNLLSQIGGAGIMPLSFLFKGSDQMMGGFKFFPSLSGPDLNEGSGFVTTNEEAQRQVQVARLKKLEADFGAAKNQILKLDTELKTMQEQVQQKLVAQRLQLFAVEEVNSIRYNPYLEPSQIKRLSGEYMQQIFAEKDPNKIDLNQVLSIADAQAEIPKTIQEYQKKVNQYTSNMVSSELLMGEFKQFDFPESNLEEFKSSADAFVTAAKLKALSYQENAEMLMEKLPEIKSLDPKSLSTLRTTYLELNNNSFSKTYRHEASGENLVMKLKLSPIDSLHHLGVKTIQMAPVSVNVFGGMRVRASIGLNFGQFFNRPKDFYVRDSILQSNNRDAFVPIMTSFMHFYAPSRKSFTVAGSFGIGFPLGGGENLQSISFFLGPSLLLGKSERIVINAGIMGGKTEQLAQGYKVGDRYLSDSNLPPTSSVYELGYYVGVSFNLASGGN